MLLLQFAGLNCTCFPWHFFLLERKFSLYLRLLSLMGVGGDNSGSYRLSVAAITDVNAEIRALGRQVVGIRFSNM